MSDEKKKPSPQEYLPAGVSPYERYQENQQRVFDWLLRWHYSTPRLLSMVLGLGKAGSGKIYKMQKRKLLQLTDSDHVPCSLVILTDHARSVAEDLDLLDRAYPSQPTRIPRNAYHDLAVQAYIVERHLDALKILPERIFNITDNDLLDEEEVESNVVEAQKRPDVLVMTPDKQTLAIEMELTVKSDVNIYAAYIRHAKALKADKYNGVVYVFRRMSALTHYKALFDVADWPLAEYDHTAKKNKIVTTKAYRLPHASRGLFQFELSTIGLTS